MGIKLDKDSFAVEKNNHATKIANAYIAYNLANLQKNLLLNFTLKNWFFGATNIVKKWMCSSEIAFDGAGWWSFGNDFARNVVTFGVDNSLSSQADNRKNKFLVLGEAPTMVLMEALVHQRKILVLI